MHLRQGMMVATIEQLADPRESVNNNPRIFADVLSLESWRTNYDGTSGRADLYVQAGFYEARISSPCARFRMKLKNAEVHIAQDVAGLINIPSATITRPSLGRPETRVAEETIKQARDGSARVNLIDAGGKLSYSEDQERINRREWDHDGYSISWQVRRTNRVLSLVLAPGNDFDTLSGSAFEADERRCILINTSCNVSQLPPEVTVDVRCKAEDIVISDIEILQRSIVGIWQNKEFVIRQYIRQEITKMGLRDFDPRDPFADVILGDVIPEINRTCLF